LSVKSLKWVARKTNLLIPEKAKSCLASATTSESRKRQLVEDLARFYKYKNIPFDKPRYKKLDKLPFIPLESEIDALVFSIRGKTARLLQLLKETGIGVGESWDLRWKDIDFEEHGQ
jgi:integrase